MDVVAVWGVLHLCRNEGSWLCSFAAVVIRLSMSGKVQTVFAMNGLSVVYSSHLKFQQCHGTGKQYQPQQGAMKKLVIEQKGLPAWILFCLGMAFFWTTMTMLVAALVGSLSQFWIPLCMWALANGLALGFHWCAFKISGASKYDVLPFKVYERGEHDKIRTLYHNMVTGVQNSAGHVGIALGTEEGLNAR